MTTNPTPTDAAIAREAFKRENRYIVFKRKDCELCMTDEQRSQLIELARVFWAYREAAGKSDFDCVVVERDWPEYEPTWKAIEARVAGANHPAQEAKARTPASIYRAQDDIMPSPEVRDAANKFSRDNWHDGIQLSGADSSYAAYWAFCAGAALQQSRAASIAADVSALSAGLPLSTPGQPYLTSRAEGDPAVEAAKEISNELIVEAQQQGLGSTAEPETITQYFAAIIRRHFAGYVPASELAAAKLRGDVLQAEVLRWTKWREEQPWLVELDGFAAQLGQHVGWLRASEAEANNLRADLVSVTEERDNYKYLWQDVATTSKDLRTQLAAARTVIEAKDAAIREQLDTLGPNGRCVPWNFAYSKLTVALALTLDAPVQAPKGGIVTARILAGDALPFPPTPTKDT